ncbi:hypothetical protein TIFTF001_030619 [Ficus carica]|uniref:Uncharacterized protein n=1 Tax=Ficus carica TaxID=3494 RepID=A0AA88J4D3_FICCA|nr:hypothetical protein TIFTF001_030619 [Ficus carica]
MVLQSAREKIKQREKESETSHFVELEHSDEVIMDYLDPHSAQRNLQAVQSAKGKRKATVMDSIDKHVESLQYSMTDVAGALREGSTIVEKMVTVLERRHPRIYIRRMNASKTRAFFAVPKQRHRTLLLKMMHTSTDEPAKQGSENDNSIAVMRSSRGSQPCEAAIWLRMGSAMSTCRRARSRVRRRWGFDGEGRCDAERW